MTRSKKKTRLRALLALALAAVAALALAGLALAKDGNDDNIPDRWEKRHNLSLKVDQSRRDQDRDGLRNRAEFRTDNDPRDKDSDDDGVTDGDEGAGTITSFDAATGRLVIDLFGDDEIAGLVTDQTRIRCEDEHSHDSGHHRGHRHGSDDAATSRSSGSGEEGDDDGHGEDGEDDPGEDSGDDDNSGPSSESSGPGSDDSGQSGNDDNGSGANCTTADLIVGSVVEEAELELKGGKAVFEEVELAS